MFHRAIYLARAATLVAALMGLPAAAQDQRIIAAVFDQPVTTLDINQHEKLQELLSGRAGGKGSRKAALNAVINEIVKIEEAKRYKMNPTDREVEARIGEISKGMKTDETGLEDKLRKQGIGMRALRQYVTAQISFARLLRYKYKEEIKVSDAEVDRKMAEIKAEINSRVQKVLNDPRMKPVTVYSILEINFPVENSNDPSSAALLQSRAAEANQYLARFKGCKSAKAAASGIFNVKVSKTIEADGSKLPKPLKSALDAKGAGGAIGPMRGQNGIQVLAFCGKRTIKPPPPTVEMPTRDQVENAVRAEKFDAVEEKYLAILRKNAIIEYKDPAYGP